MGIGPKTHYFSELIKALAKVYESDAIMKCYQERGLFFDSLEDAYFTSRYFPKTFTQNGVNQLIMNSREFLKITEEITQERFLKNG